MERNLKIVHIFGKKIDILHKPWAKEYHKKFFKKATGNENIMSKF